MLKLLRAKLHQAIVTKTELSYHGSITIPIDLLNASGLLQNEAVLVADCANGNRFETYIIAGPKGSKCVAINGAAALLSNVGHRVIIMSFIYCDPSAAATHSARIVICDDGNNVVESFTQGTVPLPED